MNNIVKHIPLWFIRKFFYKAAGMKIGKSYILMNVETDGWKNITIGDGVCINQYCHLDGRGGLTIKDNASISMYTIIITGSHDKNSRNFEYISKSVIIEERVWIGVNCTVLPGTILREGVVLAAGSVAVGEEYKPFNMYGGIPAHYLTEREKDLAYDLSKWDPFFR